MTQKGRVAWTLVRTSRLPVPATLASRNSDSRSGPQGAFLRLLNLIPYPEEAGPFLDNPGSSAKREPPYEVDLSLRCLPSRSSLTTKEIQ
jgi:hypothetical protein